MIKERITYLDVIRVIACLMVIIQHSPNTDLGVSSVLLSATGFLTYPCVPLFFMVSGALLLPVEEVSVHAFVKKRMKKILFPTLFFTLFYMIVQLCDGGDVTLINILSIPFSSQGSGVLWFMYVMAGLYIVAPIISPWINMAKRRDVEFFLLLWGVTLLYTHIESFLVIALDKDNILYYFAGYLGYFVLGYYLHRYVSVGGAAFLVKVVLLWMLPVGIYGICKLRGMEFCFEAYHSILTASMSVAWFLGIRWVVGKSGFRSSVLTELSNLSFGVYLVHMFIMSHVAWNICIFYNLRGLFQIGLTVIVVSVFSFIICEGLSRLPFSQYIIGYKKRRNDT